MNLSLLAFIALLVLYVSANTCSQLFKIRSQKFYRPFHFLGGFFIFLFLIGYLKNHLLTLLGVMTIGIIWETYERLLWKFFPKKFPKPGEKDTKDDLFIDFLGGLTASLIQIILKFFTP